VTIGKLLIRRGFHIRSRKISAKLTRPVSTGLVSFNFS